MLENFRKYTGLMLVVLILLFLGLVFLMDGAGSRGYGSGPTVLQANGRGYTQQEFNRIAQNPIRLLQDLASQQGNFQGMLAISRYLNSLAVPPDGGSFDARRFLVSRINLQKAAREYGIHASQEEVEELIQKSLFANRQGEFDAERYGKYVKRDLPRLGMGVQDMNELLGEIIVVEKLEELLGSGLQASRDTVRAAVANRQQQIDYQIVTFPRSRFESTQKPTDEEIKTYWEEHQGRYLSDAQRKITYVLAAPDWEAVAKEAGATTSEEGSSEPGDPVTTSPAPIPAAPIPAAPIPAAPNPSAPIPAAPEESNDGSCGQETEETTEEAAGPAAPETPETPETPEAPETPETPEAPEAPEAPEVPASTPAPNATTPPVAAPGTPKPAPGIPAPTPTPAPLPAPPKPADPKDSLSEQQKEEAIKNLGIKMDDLWTRIYENDGEDFEKFAKEGGFEVKSTDLFTRESAPAELQIPLRDTPGQLAVDAAFKRDKGTSGVDALSDVRRVGEDQWFLFRIDDAIEPRELSFEEAKDRARLDLVREKALEAMTEAAEKARDAVAKAMEGGASFEDAAKAEGLTFLKREEATMAKPIPGEPLPQDVFNLAAKVDPGQLSEVVTQANEERGVHRSLFVYVDKRELVDTPSYQNILEQSYRRAGDSMRQLTLQNWFAQQYAAAGVRLPSP